MQKIAVLGGTFNPIHIGHLIAAQEVIKKASLDKIVFMPSGDPPHKPRIYIAPAEDRYNMVNLAVKDNDKFDISDLEIKRKGKTYTYDTLLELHKEYYGDKIHFILGFDALKYMDNWKSIDKVFELCSFIVVNRGNYETEMNNEIKKKIDTYGADIEMINIPGIDISSTEIRNRISNNITVKYLTPDCVIDYIKEKGLYRGENDEGL